MKFYERKNMLLDNTEDRFCVKCCYKNIAKMNIFEYIYCQFKYWGLHKTVFNMLKEDVVEVFKSLYYFIANILSVALLPIALPVIAIKKIKEAKKEVDKLS